MSEPWTPPTEPVDNVVTDEPVDERTDSEREADDNAAEAREALAADNDAEDNEDQHPSRDSGDSYDLVSADGEVLATFPADQPFGVELAEGQTVVPSGG